MNIFTYIYLYMVPPPNKNNKYMYIYIYTFSHFGKIATLPERLVLVSFWYCALTGCSRYPYSSMMRYPLLAALPPPVLVSYWRTIQIWSHYPLLAALPPPVLVSYWRTIQIWCTILSWLPCLILSCVRFLFNPYCNMIQYPVLAALPPAVLVSYQVLIQIRCNILA